MRVSRVTGVWHRIYADFLMPSKLELYYGLLKGALDRGYETHSILSFWQVIKGGALHLGTRYLVLRHDVDTDTATAKAMWTMEQRLGVRASYYFRLATLDVPLMQKIEQSGSEASYHYEEIATVAKERCLKNQEQVHREIPCIRELFKANLLSLREKSGLPMITVAAHGDFVNRRLKIPNWEILKDQGFRKEVGIELEVYDEAMMRYVTSRHSDTHHPYFWKPENPLEAIRRGERIVYVLTHPRHWRINPKENLVDDMRRLWEGLRYSLCGR